MAREYKDSANREHSYAGINYAEEQPVLERKLKDSGIEWIGKIPSDWKLDSIGSLYCPRQEKVSDKDYPPLSVGKMGVVPQLENAAKTDNGDDRKLVKIGDFAINSRSDRRGSCGVSSYEGSVSLINTIITPRTSMNPQFYNWLFHTELFADEFYKWGHGIVDDLWTTRWQEMKKITIVVPPLVEQQVIADYLDEKCREIDKLVSLQEQMIEELKAYKQSVITEAVTKGLNPDAPMKDSGIDWIEDVPAEWVETKIKFHGTIRSGDGISIEEIKEDGKYPVWGGNGLMGYTDKFNESDNSIIIGRVGALCGNVRVLERPTFVSDNALILRLLNDVHVGFMYWLLIGANLNRLNTSNAQPLITGTKVKNIKIALPSIDEQRSIASYLDSKCADIDSLINIKRQKIESLKEYKKSIIFEYVTGKKQVV